MKQPFDFLQCCVVPSLAEALKSFRPIATGRSELNATAPHEGINLIMDGAPTGDSVRKRTVIRRPMEVFNEHLLKNSVPALFASLLY